MIKEAKDILEQVVMKRIPGVVVARSAADESQAIMTRKWPIIALITNPGGFDDREARTIRYADTEAGVWKERIVRGNRIVPIQLRCWGEGEDATDALFSHLLPAIPRRFEYDGFEGYIVINWEEHSDRTDNVNKLYLSVAEIQFSVPVALDETDVPTIKSVVAEPEMNNA
jgi:hypothetical protein